MFLNPSVFKNTSVFKTHLSKKPICSQKPICFHVRNISMAKHTPDSKEINFYFTNKLKESQNQKKKLYIIWLESLDVQCDYVRGSWLQAFDRWNLLRRNYWVCIFDHIYRFSLIIYFNMWHLLVGHTAILLV